MKFEIKVKKVSSEETWIETYEKDVKDPKEWAQKTIQQFNNSLRPYEVAREIVSVNIIDSHSIKDHDFVKKNLFTKRTRGGGTFDEMECKRCGITGKRYTLGGHVRYDKKFRPEIYKRCDTAKKYLDRKKRK